MELARSSSDNGSPYTRSTVSTKRLHLAWGAERKVKHMLAADPDTQPEVLDVLGRQRGTGLRKLVAANENTPPDVLSILAKNDDETVKIEVVRNHSTPEETLRELAKDPDWNVRETVSYNVNTPKELRDYLRQARWRRTGEDLEAGEGQ